ncbi:MAG TPA: TetR family transcriptional regulator [Burkholderiales bacterium]|nr:TetR family transcriptional regulator [Burkholderiales bacterium]
MATSTIPTVHRAASTRERILHATEALFILHGFDGTSLRLVTSAAKVNLGAVNYHFGGKDGLFEALIAYRLDALHAGRLRLLDQYETDAGDQALSCESILDALFIPALDLARHGLGGEDFLRFLGRVYVDPSPILRKCLSERYAPSIARFKEAFGRALPHIPRQELSWRLHFMLGALAYTLAGADAWKLISALSPGEAPDDALLLRRLAPFLIAGLRAPLPDAVAAYDANLADANVPATRAAKGAAVHS